MYLSRLMLDPRHRAVRRDLADPNQLHRTLLTAFPPPETVVGPAPLRSQHGVLHRVDAPVRDGLAVPMLVQSIAEPDWSRLPLGYVRPSETACKSIAERYGSIAAGDRLSFRLRANATRKIDTKTGPDGRRRNGRRVELRDDTACLEWLARKGAAGGFRLVRAAGEIGTAADDSAPYAVRVVRGPSARVGRAGSTSATIASVLFDGQLVVTSADAFRETLRDGVGPGKAFGCGLLSVAAAAD